MLLRSNGTFSSMILNHDLKVITGNPLAEMNHIQKDLLTKIGLKLSRRLENEMNQCFQLKAVWTPACLYTGVRGLGRLLY